MRRITRLGAAFTAAAAVWLLALETEHSKPAHVILMLVPFICIALFGFYAITVLLYGVLTFSDRPEEGQALKQDVAAAMRDLVARGVLEPDTALR